MRARLSKNLSQAMHLTAETELYAFPMSPPGRSYPTCGALEHDGSTYARRNELVNSTGLLSVSLPRESYWTRSTALQLESRTLPKMRIVGVSIVSLPVEWEGAGRCKHHRGARAAAIPPHLHWHRQRAAGCQET